MFKRLLISGALILALLSPVAVSAARTNDLWVLLSGSTNIQPNFPSGIDLLINGSNHYINFNVLSGSNGYGIRDNGGVMEFKNSGGAWAGMGSGGGGGGGGGGGWTFIAGGIYNSTTSPPDQVMIDETSTSSAAKLEVNGALNVKGAASSTSFTNTGTTWLTGLTSKLLGTDNTGQVVGTTSVGTNYITGLLATINGTAFNVGDSKTITAASSSLLGDNNTFSGATTTFSNGVSFKDFSLNGTVISSFGSGIGTASGALSVSGLTTANFSSANISQWTNNSNYITLASLSATLPLIYNSGTGAFSTLFSTTTNTGLPVNQFLYTSPTGVILTAASSSLNLPNSALANSTISGVALGGTLANLSSTDSTLTFSGTYTGAVARTIGLNLGNANTWTALQTLNASSTYLTATNFWIPGQSAGCAQFNASAQLTSTGVNCGSGSGGDSFTHTSVYGQTTSATSTMLALTGSRFSLVASSTVNFVNASSSNQTVFSNLFLPTVGAWKYLATDGSGIVVATTSSPGGAGGSSASSTLLIDNNTFSGNTIFSGTATFNSNLLSTGVERNTAGDLFLEADTGHVTIQEGPNFWNATIDSTNQSGNRTLTTPDESGTFALVGYKTGFASNAIPFGNALATLATSSAFSFANTGSLLTATNASTTNLTASQSFFGANLTNCTGTSFLQWTSSNGQFGCAIPSGGSSGGDPFTHLTPSQSATTTGLQIFASTTIGDGTQAGGLTVTGGATTTGSFSAANNQFNINSNGQISRIGNGSVSISSNALQLSSAGGSVFLQNNAGGNANSYLDLVAGSSFIPTQGVRVTLGTSGRELLRVNNLGNVGVGSSTPWAQFSIAATSTQTIPIMAISTSTATATSTAFFIDNNGLVGINKVPTVQLDVQGTASSTLLFGSNLKNCNGTSFLQWAAGQFACGTPAGAGTVTQIDTTYPITGGSITNTGTIAIAFGTTTANSWSLLQTITSASTTNFTATNFWIPGQSAGCAQFGADAKLTSTGVNCGTGGGGADPFTHVSVYGQTTSATSTLLALTGSPFSLVASSTAEFVNASTSLMTILSGGTFYINGQGFTNFLGSGLSNSAGALTVSGLTTGNFSSANISQWTNNSNYITLPSLSALFPLSYNSSTGAFSSLFSTTTNTGLTANQFVYTSPTGILLTAASSSLNLPNSALANSTISGAALGTSLAAHTVSGSITGTSYNGSAAVSDWTLNMANANTWTAKQTFGAASTTDITASHSIYTPFTSGIGAFDVNNKLYNISTTSMNASITGSAGSVANALTVSGSITGTSFNGSAAVSDWALNMANANSWTAKQTFVAASTTDISASHSLFLPFTGGLVYSDANKQATTIATSSVICSGNISCTGFAAIGASTISFTGTLGLSSGGTNASLSGANQIPYMNSGNTALTNDSLFQRFATQGSVTIGTSTTQYGLLTLASSTAPELLLGDGLAADKLWAMNVINGNFYFSTSTAVATSSQAVVGFSLTNYVWQFFSNVLVKISSATAFVVQDGFGTSVLTVNTASTTGAILQVQATSSSDTLFQVDQYGHLTASSTRASPVLSTCGTNPALGANANDVTGAITLGTGSPTACTLTFASAYSSTPIVVVSDDSNTIAPDVSAISTTAFTVTLSAALSSGHIYYMVMMP